MSFLLWSTDSKFFSKKDYELVRMQKTKDYFREQCVPVAAMVRAPPVPKIIACTGSNINVGEWVEIEHCYEVCHTHISVIYMYV
jgi:hypothetical protein